LDEIYVIDRSTTSAEAASHSGGNSNQGGDILYRWGNPDNYGASGAQVLYVVHGVNFIDECYPGAGNIILYNNGDRSGQANDYSSVEEIIPPVNGYNYDLPWDQAPTWMYEDNPAFYSNHLSGTFRLKNGNTLATEGTSAHIIEVDPAGNIVFDYSVPGFNSQLAKAVGYDPSYPGLGLISSTPLSLSTSSSDETVNGACDGTATAIVAGGIGPYNYSWDDTALQTNATATGLCAGTYSVIVTDANCDELTVSVSVGSGGSTAVISKTGNSSFILYPNPASTQLTIELPPFEGAVDIIIRDVSGREALRASSLQSNKAIDIGFMEDGVYTIEVISAEQHFVKKFLVN
jgi:hypothetical protein